MFINLTPHEIKILSAGDEVVKVLPPSGQVARVTMTRETRPGPGFSYHVSSPGQVEGLPEFRSEVLTGNPEDDHVLYVVSALVRLALPDRNDLASPGPLVRGPDGQPVGCDGLELNSW